MKKDKILWALMVVHTGEVKTTQPETRPINMVGQNDLLTFKTKKDAWNYVQERCVWTLIPCKVVENKERWFQEDVYYKFAY